MPPSPGYATTQVMTTLPFKFGVKELKAFLAEGGVPDRGQRNLALTKLATLKVLAAQGPLNAYDLYAIAGVGDLAGLAWALEQDGVEIDAKVPERGGLNPLMAAIKQKRPKQVALLLEKGAEVNVVDDSGTSALDHVSWAHGRRAPFVTRTPSPH